ncbi:AraC family transcriptional regulator [Pedobacter sp. L105]|uniref:helix-turn-helix domain-containing protein n=1 Tax=Pedobacter sp. L105 TaxID=1641871 RepID=UPI00131EAB92|nr:helix-turn-helix domain-containing protein [Pedobacter sp. L105]
MKAVERLEDFYHRFNNDNALPGKFNVYKIEDFQKTTPLPHYRRDFYKISLLTKGEGLISYADKSYKINQPILTYSNPLIPYSWEPLTKDEEGYFCLFKEDFMDHMLRAESLSQSPLFKIDGEHVLFPDDQMVSFVKNVFEKMISELLSPYQNKYQLLRSYVQILIHEGLKIKPVDKNFQTGHSSERISHLFSALLEQQFPIVSPHHPIKLKSPGQMASQLAVHPNHLNRAVRETTGKTTSELIAARIIKEAKALLIYSDWDITAIGYCLGFNYSSNFNIYFKKNTGENPTDFRRKSVAYS